MTVGVLVTAIALCLIAAAWRRSPSLEVAVLAVAAAVGLAAIEIVYVARAVILPIYLVDAALQLGIILVWVLVGVRYGMAHGNLEHSDRPATT